MCDYHIIFVICFYPFFTCTFKQIFRYVMKLTIHTVTDNVEETFWCYLACLYIALSLYEYTKDFNSNYQKWVFSFCMDVFCSFQAEPNLFLPRRTSYVRIFVVPASIIMIKLSQYKHYTFFMIITWNLATGFICSNSTCCFNRLLFLIFNFHAFNFYITFHIRSHIHFIFHKWKSDFQRYNFS